MKPLHNLICLLLAVLLCSQLFAACGPKVPNLKQPGQSVSPDLPEDSQETENDPEQENLPQREEPNASENTGELEHTEESNDSAKSEEPSEESSEPDEPAGPEHSALYLSEYSVEEVIAFFNEVCLDAEFVYEGDSSLVQKWVTPIYYQIHGEPTEYDLTVLDGFVQWLNTVEGFPGIAVTENSWQANLRFHFCTQEEMLSLMGEDSIGLDGMVRFWYMDNAIYDEIICCRTEPFQIVRNSVILEELYNGLGPLQDTWQREDSIIYAGYSEPQALTPMDELILKLLYHPDMKCGMNAQECEAVIRKLYY